jgi:hypothetical protein
LKGVEQGSEISVFNIEGKLLDRFNAASELVLLKKNGVSVITVKHKDNISVIKTIG